MTNEQKLQLADLVISFIDSLPEDKHVLRYSLVGHLNKPYGLVGFKQATIGTPVFETNDRYIVILEGLNSDISTEITFRKETLEPAIDFLV